MLIRSLSRLMPLIARARSSGRLSAPRPNSSAYARTAASGVRSSCEASATKRRSRRSDASSRSSIVFSASPRRPTSVRGSARSTRRERSPTVIESAVAVIAASGRRPSRTIHRPSRTIATITPAVTSSSITSRRWSVLSTSASEVAITSRVARPRLDRGPHPPAAVAILRRHREEAGAVGPVGVRRGNADRRREPRRRRSGRAGEVRHAGVVDHGAVARPYLDVQVRGRPRAAVGARAAELTLDTLMVGLERAVDPVEEERAQRGVGGRVGRDEADRGQHDHPEHEPRTQREPVHGRRRALPALAEITNRRRARACSRPGGSS